MMYAIVSPWFEFEIRKLSGKMRLEDYIRESNMKCEKKKGGMKSKPKPKGKGK